jgi:predicted transcriptional regulator
MYANGTIVKAEKDKIDPILSRVKNEWTKLFKDSLALLPQTISLSSNIFLVADNDASIWFASFLKDKEFTKVVLNQKYFDVTVVEGQKLLDICKVSDGTCDQFLMIESIALGRMLPK